MPASETKDTILKSAMEIIQNDGIESFTIEKVSKKANISKGGLLYHFPNKESILKEIFSNMLIRFEDKLNVSLKVDHSNEWSVNYMKSTFEDLLDTQYQASGLILALATQPALMELLRDKYKEWDKQMNKTAPNSDILKILRYAADGIWFCEVLGLSKLSKKEKNKLLEQAKILSEEESKK
ncbi:MAG: TetR/AcrR family transcriptional regulator [Spirochaetia bacterium]|nr:TetR/AcrR family transcriptional regulator [Spirochaetia bacterium]